MFDHFNDFNTSTKTKIDILIILAFQRATMNGYQGKRVKVGHWLQFFKAISERMWILRKTIVRLLAI